MLVIFDVVVHLEVWRLITVFSTASLVTCQQDVVDDYNEDENDHALVTKDNDSVLHIGFVAARHNKLLLFESRQSVVADVLGRQGESNQWRPEIPERESVNERS